MTRRPPPPDFVIIGAMKSATSTLHAQLALQSGLFMSTPKEPCFFSDDPVFAKGFDWYDGLFSGARGDQMRGESSTHYSKLPHLPNAADRLRDRRPDARIIYVLRDPIERLVSHFIHGWSEGWCRGTIEDAVRDDSGLIDYGCYARQLEPYLKAFGAAQILLVPHEGLRVRPQFELERISRFLGGDGSWTWHEEVGPANVSSARIRRGVVRRLLVDPTWATWLRRSLIPTSLRDRLKQRLLMRDRPALSDVERARLERCFDADLSILSGWLGRDIRCCNFATSTLGEPLDWVSAPALGGAPA